MSDNPLSVSILCSRTYLASLEAEVVPLAEGITCRIDTFDSQEPAESLQGRITAAADRPVIVFYSDLGDVLSQNLGHLPEISVGENRPRVVAALEDWIAVNDALSALLYRHRKTVTLLPALALVQRPTVVQAFLRDRFAPDLALPAAGQQDEPDGRGDERRGAGRLLPEGLDAKFALMASAILQTAPVAQASLAQLEAVGTPLDGFDPVSFHGEAMLDALMAETGAGVKLEALEERHEIELRRLRMAHEHEMHRLRQELDGLQLQLLQATAVQSDLSDAAARATALSGEVAELTRERSKLRRQLQTQSDAFHVAREREQGMRIGLERKIAKHTDSIVALSGDLAARDAQIARILGELETARTEVDDLRNSTSWRITAPLRHIVTGVRRLRGR